MVEQKNTSSRGLGLPARAAATAAAIVARLVLAVVSRLGWVAAGKLSEAEACELARAVASACSAALKAGGSAPARERYGVLSGEPLLVRLSPGLASFVKSEAEAAGVSAPCWLRWAASEQQRLAVAPLEPGEQARLTTDVLGRGEKCDESHTSSGTESRS